MPTRTPKQQPPPHPRGEPQPPAEAGAEPSGGAESGGPEGPEPTRYGDWERRGRCIDF